MYDLSVLNCDNRDESIVIGGTIRKNPSVHFIFEDHDATIPRAVHNKCVAGVKLDRLAVSGEASHQIGSTSNCQRPTRKVITGLEDCVFSKRIEIMIAINESAQAFHDDFEERIESFKHLVLGFRHKTTPLRLMEASKRSVSRSTFRLESKGFNGPLCFWHGTICKGPDIHALGSHGLDAVNS